MFRLITRGRLNRYRYEIAAAIFLTIAAIVLLAAAALGNETIGSVGHSDGMHSRTLKN